MRSRAFSKKGDRVFANQLLFQSQSLVDRKLGHVLRIDPRQLQNEIARTYGDTYRTFLSYGSDPNFGCTATLPERGSPRGLDIGLNPYRPSRPYLTISNNAMG
jgi:hypothetical protein